MLTKSEIKRAIRGAETVIETNEDGVFVHPFACNTLKRSIAYKYRDFYGVKCSREFFEGIYEDRHMSVTNRTQLQRSLMLLFFAETKGVL